MDNRGFRKAVKIAGFQILVVIVLFPVLGEITVRILKDKIAVMRPLQLQKETLEYAPSVFARHVFPQKEQKFICKYWISKEYGNPDYFINPKGYRGRDFDIAKKPGSIRIIVYGGSAVFDLALPEGKDWPHRIEQFFHDDGFMNIEVINAGIPGHASFDSLGRLFAEGHHFKPDYVILYNTWNDIKRFWSDQFLLRDIMPYTPRDDPFLFYKNDFDQSLGEKSLLYAFLRYSYLNWKYKPGLEGAAQKKEVTYQINQCAVDQFRLNIAMFVDCARNIGAVPILMTQGSLIEKDNQGKEKFRLRHVDKMAPYDFTFQAIQQADQIIRDVAQEKKAYLIDAKKMLVENGKPLYFDHVHLGDEGSKVLAIIVKNALKEIILNEDALSR